jgi:hypothetical protein
MDAVPLLRDVALFAMMAALVVFLVYAGWCVWSAATGRRTGDSDDEYEEEPCPECGRRITRFAKHPSEITVKDDRA